MTQLFYSRNRKLYENLIKTKPDIVQTFSRNQVFILC